MLSSDQREMLTQARRCTAALLQTLQRGLAEFQPSYARDSSARGSSARGTTAALEGNAAYTAVIDAARGTLDNLDRALEASGGASESPKAD